MCDVNPLRLKAVAGELPREVATFIDFQEMMAATDPDGLIIATTDNAHAEYIEAGLAAGKRVYCEKPVCVTAQDCARVLAAEKKSAGACFVTHNARYVPAESRIHEIISSGRIGEVLFMQFDEMLDRAHGADYFRRWHRRMENSGGLLIHKASHHFDLLNWWAQAKPKEVTARGALRFYGAAGPVHGTRCRNCPHAQRCDLYIDISAVDEVRRFYLEAEAEDGYIRDACAFGPEIDIYDQMAAVITYENKVQVSYTLTAYSPYEAQRIIVEGTEGRLEYVIRLGERWPVGGPQMPDLEAMAFKQMTLYSLTEGVVDIPLEHKEGGHGGADPSLLDDLFRRDWEAEPTERMAPLEQAVQAVLIGDAANRSIATGQAVDVQSLLRG